jgi:hypothetical protein
MLLTGALTAGSAAVLAVVAPGVAFANGCGTTTLDEATFGERFATTESIGAGSSTVEGGALHVTTPTNADKAAGYFAVPNLPLASQTAQSNYGITVTDAGDGAVPTYQLVLDYNGPAEGGYTILVYEQAYQGAHPNTWWSTQPLDNIADRTGHGSGDWGTLDEISAKYPDATIGAFGYSLGRGPQPGDANITSLTFGCNEFTFKHSNQGPTASIKIDNNSDTDYRTFWFSGTTSSDPDGDRLSYSWQVDGTEVSQAAEFTYTYPNGPRTSTVQLTVSDGKITSTVAQTVTVAPPTNTSAGGPLPGTGANVLGLAAVGGLALLGGGLGLVVNRRRRIVSGAHAA